MINMRFKLPKEFLDMQKAIHEKKYIIYNGGEIHVSTFADESITPEMKSQMRMNSYAHDDLPPKLNNAALIETAENYIMNCPRPTTPCSTYDEALIHKIVPELIKRLKKQNG